MKLETDLSLPSITELKIVCSLSLSFLKICMCGARNIAGTGDAVGEVHDVATRRRCVQQTRYWSKATEPSAVAMLAVNVVTVWYLSTRTCSTQFAV